MGGVRGLVQTIICWRRWKLWRTTNSIFAKTHLKYVVEIVKIPRYWEIPLLGSTPQFWHICTVLSKDSVHWELKLPICRKYYSNLKKLNQWWTYYKCRGPVFEICILYLSLWGDNNKFQNNPLKNEANNIKKWYWKIVWNYQNIEYGIFCNMKAIRKHGPVNAITCHKTPNIKIKIFISKK